MRNHIKYFCASFLILVSGMVDAQEQPCVTLDIDYSVEVSETTDLTGQAVITFQGKAFAMSGNGVEAYCDGSSLWTMDTAAKEAYIESVTPEAEEYMMQLAAEISSLNAGGTASFLSPEGQKVHIRVNSIKKSDGKDVSSFRPTLNFNSEWVVTDLR